MTTKNYYCSVCNSSFICKSSLKVHLSIHTGRPLYLTQMAHSFHLVYKFTEVAVFLTNSNVLFLGVKPYKCSFCPLTYRTAAHRKSHETTHHAANATKTKKPKNNVTKLLASVAMDIDQQVENLENALVVPPDQVSMCLKLSF